MTQTFTINETLIGNILKRSAIRLIKIYTLILILITLPDIINPTKPMRSIGLATCSVVALMGLTILLGYKKTRKMYSGYQITLDDEGIELKTPMAAFKKIGWTDLAYVEKENGDIKAYDNTVTPFSRWWSGTGVIFIPREIRDKDQLLLSLINHMNN